MIFDSKMYLLFIIGTVIIVFILFAASLLSYLYNIEELKAYFNSQAFSNVIISIIIPIIIFLWRIYDTKNKEREQEHKEKIKQRQQKHKEERLGSIKKTFEEWNKINSLVSKVRFCDGKIDLEIRNIQLSIAEHSISFGELIHIWSSMFPIMPESIITTFVKYTACLYWGAWAVAYCIRNGCYGYNIKELQESLGMFQRSIINIAFLNLSFLLKNSSELLEDIEEYFSDNEKKQYEITFEIQQYIEKELKTLFEAKAKEKNLYSIIVEYRKIYRERYHRQEGPFIKENSDQVINVLNTYKKEIEKSEKKIKEKYVEDNLPKNITDHQREIITRMLRCSANMKMNELLLGIDIFWEGSITPFYYYAKISLPYDLSSINVPDKAMEFIELYEQLADIIMSKKIPTNVKEWDGTHYDDLKKDDKYVNYVSSFYSIPSDEFMTLNAINIVEFIRFVGRTVRFERALFPDETLTPVL